MQLSHIPGISPEQERQARVRAGLSAAWLEDRRLAYHVHSSYHAAAQNGDTALLLDEHYRCRPEIADVVNGHCYSGTLEILTDVRGQVPAVDLMDAGETAPVLAWANVPSGESARGPGGKSWRNPSEGDAVTEVVRELLHRLPETVPVPAPGLRQDPRRRDLTDAIQQFLASRGVVELERDAMVGGQRIDLLFTAAAGNIAVLIDTGPLPGRDPARHLLLLHERASLLIGLPSGGLGAKAGSVERVLRIPAWRVLAGPHVLAPLFD